MPSSTRSNKETQLLLSPDPASLERSIRKEERSSSIDNNACSSLNSCQPLSRDVHGHTIRVHNKDIRRLLERASRDEHNYICLPEHASSFTQTKLVPEIYTKDEINEMFYGICGEQEKNKEDFQMKLDGVYYPLNDSISWLTTCMEEMRQDKARIKRATDVSLSTSIDKHRQASIDSRLYASIDDRFPASVDDYPPHSHMMKSQPDFHTREEIDQLVEGIYGALETT